MFRFRIAGAVYPKNCKNGSNRAAAGLDLLECESGQDCWGHFGVKSDGSGTVCATLKAV